MRWIAGATQKGRSGTYQALAFWLVRCFSPPSTAPMGSRTGCRNHLQLVDAAHAQSERLHRRACRDKRVVVDIHSGDAPVRVLALTCKSLSTLPPGVHAVNRIAWRTSYIMTGDRSCPFASPRPCSGVCGASGPRPSLFRKPASTHLRNMVGRTPTSAGRPHGRPFRAGSARILVERAGPGRRARTRGSAPPRLKCATRC